jgi:hypothetical protein
MWQLACWNPSDEELLSRKMLDAQIKMPVPPATDVIVYDHFAKWGMASAETRFSTSLPAEQIEAFYERELLRRGWTKISDEPSTRGRFCWNGWLARLEFSPRRTAAVEYSFGYSWRSGLPRSPCRQS